LLFSIAYLKKNENPVKTKKTTTGTILLNTQIIELFSMFIIFSLKIQIKNPNNKNVTAIPSEKMKTIIIPAI